MNNHAALFFGLGINQQSLDGAKYVLIIFMKVFLCQLDIKRLIGFSFLGFILLFLLPFEHEESKENG
jgi:hypothetical protein